MTHAKCKQLKKKLCSLATAGAVASAVLFSAVPSPTAEALSLGGIVNAGIGLAQANAQKSQIKKQLDYLNDTEEGRQELFNSFKAEYGVNQDPALNERVDVLMRNLTEAVGKVDPTIHDKPYLYFVNASQDINAFCAMGHVMSINTGILEKFPNDDEIAVVVGHEMGHGQKNHTYRNTLAKMDKQLFASIAVALEGGSTIGQVVGSLALNQSIAHGTKSNEKEADDLSFEYIARSNYNIGATAAVWQRFLDLYGNNAQNALGSLFAPSDHPNNGARRDKYVTKIYEYSGKHATAKDGTVIVNEKAFVTPVAAGDMSPAERSYFVLGNLARAFHDGKDKQGVSVQNGTVMMGDQAIITPVDGDEPAEAIAERLKALIAK